METVMRWIVYVISLGLIAAGGRRTLCWWLRRRQCTAGAVGRVEDVMEKKSLLSWPNQSRYYPIFSYEADGKIQMQASDYPAQTRGEIEDGREFPICYDPRRPNRCFAQGWDERNIPMGIGQILLGALFLTVTLALR